MKVEIEALDFAFDFIRKPGVVVPKNGKKEEWREHSEDEEDIRDTLDGEKYDIHTLLSLGHFDYGPIGLPSPLNCVRLRISRQGPVYNAYFTLSARNNSCFNEVSEKFNRKLKRSGLEFVYDSNKTSRAREKTSCTVKSPFSMLELGAGSPVDLNSQIRQMLEAGVCPHNREDLGGVGNVFELKGEKPCYSIMDVRGMRDIGMGCNGAYPRRYLGPELEFRSLRDWINDFKNPEVGFEAIFNLYLSCCYTKDPLPGRTLSLTP